MSARRATRRAASGSGTAAPAHGRDQAVLLSVVETKLIPPSLRAGTVVRAELLDRLIKAQGSSVVSIFAPAGYGKTTLLAQSIAREPRPVAWVSLDEGDNDPVVLLSHVAVAVDRVLPLTPALFAMLSSPGTFEPIVINRVCSELSTLPEHVLVLDDVQLVSGSFSRDAIAALALHVGQGSQTVLSGRRSHGLPIARLRANGGLLEIGAADLALDAAETRSVLEHAGVSVSDDDSALLAQRTEGWAIAVYLAALSLDARGRMDDALTAFTGKDRYVVDYVRSEFLADLAPADVRFLTETAILDRLSGPLCDAVLKTTGSARKLEELERSNLNVVPLDRTREWYRYHHLFRDALRSELMRREPEAVAALHRRAAAWLEGSGEAVAAVEHVLACDDLEHAERLIAPLVLALEQSGRGATTRRWLDALGPDALERLPALALAAGWFAALGADRSDAERWLAIAERRTDEGFSALGAASAAAGVALLRALMCPAGIEQMRADAEFAAESETPWRPWHVTSVVVLGFAHVMAGDDVRGAQVLADGVRVARRLENATNSSVAMAQLALYALERGELSDAEGLSREAHERAGNSMLAAATAFALVARARVAQRRGDGRRLAEYVAGVQVQRPKLTAAIPWISALTLLQLTRVHIVSGDSAGARTILPGSYQSAVDAALAAGTPVEDVVGVLIAVTPMIGSARLVAAAPLLARAVGFDVDEAFDRD